ncbi:hypothetical protein N2152v2_005476 [Parachlorella kessleri]
MTEGPLEALEEQLMEACREGQAELARRLLDQGAEPGFQDAEGVTPLMLAAESGNAALVSALLEAGAPWHAQDNEGYTAGEYASGSQHKHIVELLLDWAVRAELILGTVSRREKKAAGLAANRDYLSGTLRYEDGKLIDAEGEAVMMGWEAPLMERHAEIICSQGGDVLNVGFGLGIIDAAIQRHAPRSHTIIEAHPDVYQYMLSQGWDKKAGLGPFDGIFFDTYGEYYEDMHDFHVHLPRLLKPGGIYSFFNGLAPDNIFFHLVYGKIAELELARLGLRTKYQPVPIDASADKVWEGVKNRYWHLPVYFVPTCVLEAATENGEVGKVQTGQERTSNDEVGAT